MQLRNYISLGWTWIAQVEILANYMKLQLHALEWWHAISCIKPAPYLCMHMLYDLSCLGIHCTRIITIYRYSMWAKTAAELCTGISNFVVVQPCWSCKCEVSYTLLQSPFIVEHILVHCLPFRKSWLCFTVLLVVIRKILKLGKVFGTIFHLTYKLWKVTGKSIKIPDSIFSCKIHHGMRPSARVVSWWSSNCRSKICHGMRLSARVVSQSSNCRSCKIHGINWLWPGVSK